MSYNPFSLEGKTVLVTGASSGIGRATAIECSRMGATVICSGRNSERLDETFAALENKEFAHKAIEADLTDTDQLKNLVAECPVIDGAAFCAGMGQTTLFPFSTKEKFERVFDVNFFSPVELFRLMLKKKKINDGASIVFVVSVGGTRAVSPGNAIYGSSKAALESMMKFAALELAPKKIRVNGVLPGMVETPIMQGGFISAADYDLERDRYPMKRFGQPEEIAWSMIYLMSDAAKFVTGSSLVLDGGAMLKFG